MERFLSILNAYTAAGFVIGLVTSYWAKTSAEGTVLIIVVCLSFSLILKSVVQLISRKLHSDKPVPKQTPSITGHTVETDEDSGLADDTSLKKQVVLFLGIHTSDNLKLDLGSEVREIETVLAKAQALDRFTLEQRHSVRSSEMQDYLLRYRPSFVHISGHGREDGKLMFEDESGFSEAVSVAALSETFRLLKDDIKCVVLNTCYSEKQALSIAAHIDFVIGMKSSIQDLSAIAFSSSFYRAIAYGRDIRSAFDLARNEIDLNSLQQEDVPRLFCTQDS